MEVATKAQLDRLVGRSTVVPPLADGPPGMPDPEPEVLLAAKALIDQMLAGQGFSQVSDDLLGKQLPAQAVPQVDERQKLAFLAHVLENQPYERQSTLLRGRMQLTFRAIPTAVDRQLVKQVLVDEQRGQLPVDRDLRYSRLLMGASLSEMLLGGQLIVLPPPVDVSDVPTWCAAFSVWADDLDRPTFQLIYQAYKRFEHELAEMLAKADDPSFWPTP